MSNLQEFVNDVKTAEPDGDTITLRRGPVEAVAEFVEKRIKSARKGGLRGKGGRKPVLTDPAAIKNREAVRRSRARRKKK